MRNGELPLRFVRLQDEQEGPRVKVALFGNEACKDYSSGENISVTDVYKYKDTNTLSTKKSCKTEVCCTSFLFCSRTGFWQQMCTKCKFHPPNRLL